MAARVAFQGERGAFSEMAALQYFPNAKVVPLKSFQDVFNATEGGDVDYAVVPVENSIEGTINENYDLLLQTKMSIVGEIYQRIRHCLITNKNAGNIRFLVLSLHKKTEKAEAESKYKTSIIFSIKHVPGALFEILSEFAIHKINLTKIESRPTKETPWEYNFYVDIEGNLQDIVLHKALQSIKSKALCIKILGSYKKAEFC